MKHLKGHFSLNGSTGGKYTSEHPRFVDFNGCSFLYTRIDHQSFATNCITREWSQPLFHFICSPYLIGGHIKMLLEFSKSVVRPPMCHFKSSWPLT